MSIINWRNYFCELLGCRADCSQEEEALLACLKQNDEYEERIRELEKLVPREPPPKLDYIVEKNDAWVTSQLNIVRLRLDNTFKITNKDEFIYKVVPYDLTDQLPYIKSIFDCEDYTFLFKVNMHLDFGINQMAAVLDYKSGHSYGLVLFDNSENMILEIQNDGLYLWTERQTDFYSLEGAVALI
jgi:hypothetical protein